MIIDLDQRAFIGTAGSDFRKEEYTPLEVGYQRGLLVNKEEFLTGQAAGLSNGVNT